tara:strand:- start:9585 stop:10244 length:660 start_codon:yes stop_codon:yes gene_type:complete
MNNIYRLSFVVLIIVVILLVWDGCSKNAQLSAYQNKLSNYKLKEQVFTERINKDGNRIAEQQQTILTNKEALEQGLLMINDFNNVQSQVKLTTRTRIDSVFVPFEIVKRDTQIVYTSFDKRFILVTKDYAIYGQSLRNGVRLDSLFFDSQATITIGNKSQGIFRKSKPVVQINYDNPYIQTTSMQNVIIQEELKWYDRKRNWFGIGMGLGLVGTFFIMK